jgi:hypothetical protein
MLPEVTVSVVFLEIPPEAAVMVVEPAAIEVARPALLIVATPGFEELHVTDVVISFVVLSVWVPVAVNCCLAPQIMLGLPGVTDIAARVAEVPVGVEGIPSPPPPLLP